MAKETDGPCAGEDPPVGFGDHRCPVFLSFREFASAVMAVHARVRVVAGREVSILGGH